MRWFLDTILGPLKVLLAILAAALAFVAFVAWTVPITPGRYGWALRLALPPIAALCVWPLVRRRFANDLVPDQLALMVGQYFERDGVCFALTPAMAGNVSRLIILTQNRFERDARLRIVLQPPRKNLSLRRRPGPQLDLTIDCPGGGAVVACQIDWPIPKEVQGKTVRLEVTAGRVYPGGRGCMLRRSSGGIRVEEPAGNLMRAGLTMMTLMMHAHHERTSIKWQLPTGVCSVGQSPATAVVEMIWRPPELMR